MFAQALARSFRLFKGETAFIYDNLRIGWTEVAQSVASVAGAMHAAGIRPGDRVAVLAGNTPAHVVVMYSVAWAGAVLVPINTRLAAEEMGRILVESGAKAFFSDGINRHTAGLLLGNFPLVSFAMDESAAGDRPWAEASAFQPIEPAAVEMSALAAIYYTGGTTGAPKGVMLSDGALLLQTMSTLNELAIRGDSIVQQAPPLYHLAGAGLCHACTFTGATQILLTKFDAQELLRSASEYKATHVSVVPTMLTMILELDGVAEAFASVERMIYGTSAISDALVRKLMAVCPGAKLIQIYGQTECSGPCLFLPPEAHALDGANAARLAAAGRPGSFSEVRIVDPQDRPVAIGSPGEIVVRGPSVMLGYWNNKQATDAALRGGWLHTGDVGVEDEGGYIRIVDRIKDMIVTGGENVFCAEVESVIMAHPEVRFCAVFGIPDEKWGERVHAVVGVRPGSRLVDADIITHCRTLLAGYKCPKSITFRSDLLPISAVGKVRKDLLRAEHAG